MAVLRYVGQTMGVFVTDALFRHVFPIDGNGTGAHIRNAGNGMNKLCLAVTVDAGDTNDLTSFYLE